MTKSFNILASLARAHSLVLNSRKTVFFSTPAATGDAQWSNFFKTKNDFQNVVPQALYLCRDSDS